MIIGLWIALAGGLGAATRLITDGVITSRLSRPDHPTRGRTFPIGTFVINVLGSFLLGLTFGLTQQRVVGQSAELIIGTGFLGGFTTFSAASVETVRLLGGRRWRAAVVCGAGMLVAAIGAAALGFVIAS